MIKLLNILKENINRDPRHWIEGFNLLGVTQQFNQQFYQRTNKNFYGKINVLIFNRKDLKEIETHINSDRFLSGYLPKGDSEFWDEDFLLTLETIYPKAKLISKLTPIKNKVFLLQIECSKDPRTKQTVVSVPSYW
jgi:hypothetical protein